MVTPTIVEVFKTNVQEKIEAQRILRLLMARFAGSRINFDLEDCDRILRVEDETIDCNAIIAQLQAAGYACETLS